MQMFYVAWWKQIIPIKEHTAQNQFRNMCNPHESAAKYKEKSLCSSQFEEE